MKHKFQMTLPPVTEPVKEVTIKIANFTINTPIFVNYLNKVSNELYDLSLKENFLMIKDKVKGQIMLVPLTNIASLEIV